MIEFIINYADNFYEYGSSLLKVVIAWGLTFWLLGFFVLTLVAVLSIYWEWLADRLFLIHSSGGEDDE